MICRGSAWSDDGRKLFHLTLTFFRRLSWSRWLTLEQVLAKKSSATCTLTERVPWLPSSVPRGSGTEFNTNVRRRVFTTIQSNRHFSCLSSTKMHVNQHNAGYILCRYDMTDSLSSSPRKCEHDDCFDDAFDAFTSFKYVQSLQYSNHVPKPCFIIDILRRKFRFRSGSVDPTRHVVGRRCGYVRH